MRSKADLRRRCLAVAATGSPHLWTFGRRGLFPSRQDAVDTWTRYARAAHRLIGPYVAVIEFKNGGWHIHVCLAGFKPINAMRRMWYRALGGTGDERSTDTPGSVNVRTRQRGSGSTDPRSIANYLAKYLGKDGENAPSGKKAFMPSRGLDRGTVRRFAVPHSLGASGGTARIRQLLEAAYDCEFNKTGIFFIDGTSGCKYYSLPPDS